MVDTVVYRTAGDWGTGKGADLDPEEVDTNFWALVQAINDLLANPVQAVSIAEITVLGRQMTVHLTNATTLGPFELPIAAMRWRDEWAADTSYLALDVFLVPGVGVFLVLVDHVSGDEFDPNLVIGTDAEAAYRMLFAVIPPGGGPNFNIYTIADPSFAPGSTHHGGFIRMMAEEDSYVLLPARGPDEAPVNPIGMELRFRQGTDFPVHFLGAETDVEVVGRAGRLNQTQLAGDFVMAKLVSFDGVVTTWELSHDLAPDVGTDTTV